MAKVDFVTPRLVPHARCAIRDNLLAEAGEDLVILWDETVSVHLFQAFGLASEELSLNAVSLTYRPLAYRPIKEYGLFPRKSLRSPARLPRTIKAMLLSADAFVFLCSDTELLFSPDLKEILDQGKRGLFLPYLDCTNAERMLFTEKWQVDEQYNLINAVAECFGRDEEAHITSSEGTDLYLSLGEFNVLRRKGITRPGEIMFLPAGNVANIPNGGTANGILVIDRTICANDYKELHEPIIFKVSKGWVTNIEGGLEARILREFLEGLNDSRVYHLTELAVGTNPLCKWSGIGAPSEDTHVWGTVAFALGCDTHIGGNVPAPVHIDMTMRFPTLKIGNEFLVREGRLLVGGE